jgi:Tfp pilus assembly protein PilF
MNAIHLNNMGVVSFENNRLDEAVDLFQAALASSKQSILENESSSGRPSSNSGQQSGLARMTITSIETRSPPRLDILLLLLERTAALHRLTKVRKMISKAISCTCIR